MNKGFIWEQKKKTKQVIFVLSGIKVSKHFIWIENTSITSKTKNKPDCKGPIIVSEISWACTPNYK